MVEIVIFDYMSPHCDLDLADSILIFLHDTLAHEDLVQKDGILKRSGIKRTKLLGRCVEIKKLRKILRARTIERVKAKWSEFEIHPFFQLGANVGCGEEV